MILLYITVPYNNNDNTWSKNFDKRPHHSGRSFQGAGLTAMQCDNDQPGALQPTIRSPAVTIINFLLRKLPQH